MENLVRTAEYLAELAERRRALTADLEALVPGSEPQRLVWEVGSGHGHFLNAYAAAHPGELCVGVDITSERVERALKKRNRARLANLTFFHADGRLFLEVLPPHVQISRAFILFPDPWPKLRHRKHRIIQTTFLSQLARCATADCRLYFRTDFTPYFEDARSLISRHADWEVIDAVWPFEFVTVFQSRAEGHHSLIARRRGP